MTPSAHPTRLRDKVSGKLVFGDNVSHATQFVETGAADAAIIAYSFEILE